jgi:hypothetical protein
MADNKVSLKIGADTSEIERAFGALIKKIQGDAEKLKLTPTASKVAPGVESIREAASTSRSLNQKVREEKAGLDIINRELSKKKALIDEIARKQESSLKGSREELALAQRLNREKERFQQAEKIAMIQKENYRKSEEAASRAQGSSRPTGGGTAGGSFPSMFGLSGPAAVGSLVSSVGASVGQAGLTAGSLYRYFAQAPIQTVANTGSAMQATLGRELEAAYSGRSGIELAYAPEKSRALQMAEEARKRKEATQFTDIGSSMFKRGLIGAGAGIVGGAYMGATAGVSGGILAPITVPLGAAAGAIGGGVVGGLAGAGSVLGDESKRNVLLSPFSKTADKARQAELAKDFADNFSTALEGLKNENPLKRLAAEDYQQNYMKNLDFQRSTGLNYGTFHGHGGFRESTINAGFTPELGTGMSSGILGAGGSTAASRDLSTFGLQLQRGFNLTNASSVIGQLSGSMGQSGTTKEATVRLLQEGVSLGFDNSKYAEESRKFIEAGAAVVAKSGTNSLEGVSSIMETFGKFFGADKSTQGIQAGVQAYQKYQELSTTSEGPRGVMRAGGILGSKIFGNLSAEDRMAVSSIPLAELTPDDERVKALARKTNKTPEEIVAERKKIDASSTYRTDSAQGAIDRYKTVKASALPKGMSGPTANPKAIEEAKQDAWLASQHEFLEFNKKQREEFIEGTSGGIMTPNGTMSKEDVLAQAGKKVTGKIEDRSVANDAESSRIIVENFQKMSDQIVPTTKAMADFNKQLQATVDIIMKMPEAERAGPLSKLYRGLFPSDQPQSGRPGGK